MLALTQAADGGGVSASARASPTWWPADGARCLSASDTTARATVTAAYRSGACTVTMLMILSSMCALTMLADLRHAALSAATGERDRVGKLAVLVA